MLEQEPLSISQGCVRESSFSGDEKWNSDVEGGLHLHPSGLTFGDLLDCLMTAESWMTAEENQQETLPPAIRKSRSAVSVASTFKYLLDSMNVPCPHICNCVRDRKKNKDTGDMFVSLCAVFCSVVQSGCEQNGGPFSSHWETEIGLWLPDESKLRIEGDDHSHVKQRADIPALPPWRRTGHRHESHR